MAVVMPPIKGGSAVEIVREQHWTEMGDWLGEKPSRVKETMKLWFSLLHQLGYDLVPTGMNQAVPHQKKSEPVPAPPAVSRGELYRGVEDGLMEIVQRRLGGERISDQEEVRTIVASVMTCLGLSE